MDPNNKDLREQLAAIKEAKKTQGIPEKSVIEGFFKKGVYTWNLLLQVILRKESELFSDTF